MRYVIIFIILGWSNPLCCAEKGGVHGAEEDASMVAQLVLLLRGYGRY